jgi:hypothetical protein
VRKDRAKFKYEKKNARRLIYNYGNGKTDTCVGNASEQGELLRGVCNRISLISRITGR